MSLHKRIIENKTEIILISLGLILRLFLFFIIAPYTDYGEKFILTGDAPGYNELATLISSGQPMSDAGPFLSTLRTPGYPIFISLFYFLFNNVIWIPILFQVIIDSFMVLIIMKMTRLFYLNKIDLYAGIFWAIEPFFIIYSNTLYSDMLFVWLLLISYYQFFKFFKYRGKINLFYSSLFLGLSTLVRPISLLLIFVNLLFIVTYQKINEIKLFKFRKMLIYSFIFFLIICIWCVRNKIVHKHFFFSSSGDYNSLMLYAAPIFNDDGEKNIEEVLDMLLYKHKYLYNNDRFLYYKKYNKKAIQIILSNKMIFMKHSIYGVIDMFFSIEKVRFEKIVNINSKVNCIDFILKNKFFNSIKYIINNLSFNELIYIILFIVFLFIEYFLVIIGIFISIKSNKNTLILLIPILYFVVITGSAGIGRFKLPIIPFYLIFCAIGFKNIAGKFNNIRLNLFGKISIL